MLLALCSTDWTIRLSYLLMHNLLQILLSREKRKYWRLKRHMLFASWHFPSLILAPCFELSLFFFSLILLSLSFCLLISFYLALSMPTWSSFPLPAQQFACPILIGSIWILFNIISSVIFFIHTIAFYCFDERISIIYKIILLAK